MLTNFAKDFIIDVLRGSECASESNNIKSYQKIAAEAILKMKFSKRKTPQVFRNQNKDIAIF